MKLIDDLRIQLQIYTDLKVMLEKMIEGVVEQMAVLENE